jgi:hypothetical protein
VKASLFDAIALLIAVVTLGQLPFGLSVGAAASVLIPGPHGVAAAAAAGVLLSATETLGGLYFAAWAALDSALCYRRLKPLLRGLRSRLPTTRRTRARPVDGPRRSPRAAAGNHRARLLRRPQPPPDHPRARRGCRLLMPTTRLLLVTGAQLEVEGSIEDVAKELENAARNSVETLAWLTEAANRQALGVNAARVVTVRPGEE